MLPPVLAAQLRSLLKKAPSFSEKERQKLAEWIADLEWTQQNEAIRFFVPHGGQEQFLKLIEEPEAFIVISGAGNGWGKSEIIVAIFAAIMWPRFAPSAMSHPAFTKWKYPKRARIYSKPAELEEIGSLQTAILKLFPKGRYSANKGKYSYPSIFVTDSGWVLDLFSYERDHSEAAGPNIGLQAFNEPPPEALWREGIARSRAGGLILGGMTSLLDNPWAVDGILNKHNGKDVRVRYGNACENCKQHGKNGHLEHSQIEKILAQYPPDERDARFSGKPLSLSGRIYKTFDRAVHVAKDPIIPPAEDVTHYMAVDPAVGKPFAVVYAFVDAAGIVNIWKEWPDYEFYGARDPGLTVKEYVAIFRAIENGRPVTRIMDRHFGNARRSVGGLTLKQEFIEAGMDFQDSYTVGEAVPEVETGIYKVADYLRYDRSKPLDGVNRPRLIISPDCPNTIASFERWIRDIETKKPVEDYKDFADATRYLLMANPTHEIDRPWVTPRGPAYGVG